MTWDAMPDMPGANDRIMLFVHGLCMTDSQWLGASADGRQVDLSMAVARELGYTPVFLRYNTGLHISLNGRELSRQLELLVKHWPTPLNEMSIVAHSMGGLLSRSALQVAPGSSVRDPWMHAADIRAVLQGRVLPCLHSHLVEDDEVSEAEAG